MLTELTNNVLLSTFKNNFFGGLDAYKDITFIKPGESHGCDAIYRIGWFKKDNKWEDRDKNPNQPNVIPLQQAATDILGLEYKEVVPKINKPNKPNRYGKKFVCFSPHASASAKYWHNEQGWQTVINYIKNVLGYEVVMISKEFYESEWETMDFREVNVPSNVPNFESTGDGLQDATIKALTRDYRELVKRF